MTSLVTSDDLPHLLNALLAMQSTRIVYQNEVRHPRKGLKPSSHGTNPPPSSCPAHLGGPLVRLHQGSAATRGNVKQGNMGRALEWKLQNEFSFAHHESQKGPETHLQKIKSARSQTTGISNGSVDESTGGAVLYSSTWSYKPGKRSESIMSRPENKIHSPSSKGRPSSKFRAQKKKLSNLTVEQIFRTRA